MGLRRWSCFRNCGRRIEQSGKIREPIKGPCDLPLSSMCKRTLSYAAEEADGLSSKHISTEHLLLGLLREEKCFAAEYLYGHGVRLASVREGLKRAPHKYSESEKFVREPALPEDVVEVMEVAWLKVKGVAPKYWH